MRGNALRVLNPLLLRDGACAEHVKIIRDNAGSVPFRIEQFHAVADTSGEVKETSIEGTSPEISAVMSSQTLPDTIGILFNCDQKALKDSRVRSALSMAVDREYIASEILSGVYEPSSHQELFDTVSGEPDDRNQGTEDKNYEKRCIQNDIRLSMRVSSVRVHGRL